MCKIFTFSTDIPNTMLICNRVSRSLRYVQNLTPRRPYLPPCTPPSDLASPISWVSSTNNIFSVVVRCGGFRSLYGWLGDVWERVRAHKLPRAGPPDWRGVGGRVFVEELLCVLARVPISVDMLRETVSVSGELCVRQPRVLANNRKRGVFHSLVAQTEWAAPSFVRLG